ncbi:MAG: TerC/Alx family metal homeostasis membrane protein [Acidobacteriaceae bacterium]
MILFALIVAALLFIDLGVLHRKGRCGSPRTAALWTVFLVVLAAAYTFYIGWHSGHEAGFEFASSYLIEASLSIDNLFVFLIMFRALRLEEEQQHRVLLWGILGAIVLRGLFIVVGVQLLDRFVWVQYIFGVILAIAAIRLLTAHPHKQTPSGPVRWLLHHGLRRLPDGRLVLASFLLVICAVELTDLVFALDSVPAVLAVTRSPIIAWTSNVFAILGLRSLYFVLAGLLDRFHLLHYGLGIILAFVAFKMLAAHWVHISTLASLCIILAVVVAFITLSLTRKPQAT